jgi:hypothetical protein
LVRASPRPREMDAGTLLLMWFDNSFRKTGDRLLVRIESREAGKISGEENLCVQ